MGKYGLFFLGLLLGWWLAPQADTRAPLSPESAVENRIDIDIGYAQSMLVHHQQALIMASLMQGDQQSAVQGLASRIVREQSMEMESLKGWLAGQRAASLPASGDLMGWMKNNSTLGFFVNDLHRHPLAYHSIKLITSLFSKSYLVKNDAPLSVARGFKKDELIEILQQSSIIHYQLKWMWAFRWLLIYKHD